MNVCSAIGAEVGSIQVTRGSADLVIPISTPSDNVWRYGNGSIVQVAPHVAAVFCNIRFEKLPSGDFEAGMDAVVFNDHAAISAERAVTITRTEKYQDSRTGQPRIRLKHTQKGGFVPLGAKREDGSPHPHAGTGFLMGEVLDFPMRADGSYDKAEKTRSMVRYTEINHLVYDGDALRVVNVDLFSPEAPMRVPDSEWSIFHPGLRSAIADGDDLLFPVGATSGDASRCWPKPYAMGLSRWRSREGRWRPVEFVPVSLGEPVDSPQVVYGETMMAEWIEPSLVRDTDGSLLISARGVHDGDNIEQMIRIWRSLDKGQSWNVLLERRGVRGQAPITINQAADGTPYIIACPVGRERELLYLWSLNTDRSDLLDPVVVRDARQEFGPPPTGPVWFMDHPNAMTVRLADGLWHHLLLYRVMDRGEHGGADPAPQSGIYIEEVISQGNTRAEWRFQ